MNSLPSDRIAVKTLGRIVVLRYRDIDWIRADQDYAELYIGPKSWLIRATLSSLELRLGAAGFMRIHRSTLVNVERVRELRPLSKGEYTVILIDGTELKLSRNYRHTLRSLAGLEAS